MFTPEQLNTIKRVASKSKNQGELAIHFDNRLKFHINEFSAEQIKVVNYCAEECKRQHSGEMGVYDMVNAWNFARGYQEWVPNISLGFIDVLGQLVEPVDNRNGFRRIPIYVGNSVFGYTEKAAWENVPRLLTALIEAYYEGVFNGVGAGSEFTGLHPLSRTAEDQFYYEYENIHPFRDGNGRTGKILYNYLLNSLANPIMPPNFWGSGNP